MNRIYIPNEEITMECAVLFIKYIFFILTFLKDKIELYYYCTVYIIYIFIYKFLLQKFTIKTANHLLSNGLYIFLYYIFI